MSDVRWEGYSHEEIYARVQEGPGRLASADAEAAWSTVESTIRTVDAQLTRAVRQIGAGWQGRAADAVHGGMTVMSNWALDAAGDATLTRNGITGQAEQAARLRTAMPPPRTAEWERMVHEEVPAVGLMSATGDLGALEERMANDHAVAVDMMNRYSSQSSDNQRMMNFWTPPPTVVVEAVGPGSSAGGASPSGAFGAAAVPVRPEAARAAPTVDMSAAELGPGASPTSGLPIASAASAPGAAAPAGGPVVGGPVVAGSAASGAGPAEGAGRSPGTAVRPDGGPATASPTAGRASAAAPGAGRTAPGVVARPPTASGPAAPPARRPTGPGGLPYESTTAGGVRPIVPGPPAQAGTAGGRAGPVGLPDQVPRSPGPGSELAPRSVGMSAEGERAAATRSGSGHGLLPMAGAARPVDQEHRRPAYLVDDSDAFADDRWFPPPVIGGDVPVSHV